MRRRFSESYYQILDFFYRRCIWQYFFLSQMSSYSKSLLTVLSAKSTIRKTLLSLFSSPSFVSSAIWAPPVHSQREAANTTSWQILSWAHRLHNPVVSPSCWDPSASCDLSWSCSHKMKKTVLLKLLGQECVPLQL